MNKKQKDQTKMIQVANEILRGTKGLLDVTGDELA